MSNDLEPNAERPALIVGLGLAGAAVAWRMWQRGLPFHIVDAGEPVTCSKIAAGLVTAVTGKKLNLSWRFGELYGTAVQFYRSVEGVLGREFYHETPHVRLLRNEAERDRWAKRQLQPDIAPWIDGDAPQPLVDSQTFETTWGGFQQHSSGWLDTADYLAASQAFFASLGRYEEAWVQEDDLVSEADRVIWNGREFSCAILCRGWRQHESRFFPWLVYNSARGVIGNMRLDLGDERRVISNGPWLQPRGGGVWRVGSTYEFDFSASLEASLADLQQRHLSGLLRTRHEITDAQVGIRPIIKHKPLVVLGRHPKHQRIALLNGLGSKGTVRAPFFADLLVEHLVAGRPIEDEVDVQSNYP